MLLIAKHGPSSTFRKRYISTLSEYYWYSYIDGHNLSCIDSISLFSHLDMWPCTVYRKKSGIQV
jgi:hypothetical protein